MGRFDQSYIDSLNLKDMSDSDFKNLTDQTVNNFIGMGKVGRNWHETTEAVDELNQYRKSALAEKATEARLAKQHDYADTLSKEASDFRSNLPGYESTQISSATDTARNALHNDLYNVKANSNARGLLYSGVNTENQGQARATQAGKLGRNIQNINDTSENLAAQKDQAATAAQSAANFSETDYAQYKTQQSQDSYKLALQQQQNQSSFFGGLVGAGAGLGAMAVLAL